MFRVMFCGHGNTSTVIRIAISQLVLYGMLIALQVCGGIFFKGADEKDTLLAQRVFFVGAGVQIIPFCLAIVLYVGALIKNYSYIRGWIFMKIFETIINTLLLLSAAVFFALHLEIYYGILVCVIPIIIGLSMLESVVVVNVYYNSKTKSPNKNQFADPANIYNVA